MAQITALTEYTTIDLYGGEIYVSVAYMVGSMPTSPTVRSNGEELTSITVEAHSFDEGTNTITYKITIPESIEPRVIDIQWHNSNNSYAYTHISQLNESLYADFQFGGGDCNCFHTFPSNIIGGGKLLDVTISDGYISNGTLDMNTFRTDGLEYGQNGYYRIYFKTASTSGLGSLTNGQHPLLLSKVSCSDGIDNIAGFDETSLSSGATVNINKAKTIDNYAFQGTTVGAIKGGNELTQIGWNAFENCKLLSSISLSDTITTIGNYAFSGCTSLENIHIPTSLSRINCSTFSDCIKLTSITIPSNIATIAPSAFFGCSGLTSVTFPTTSSYLEIGYQAFARCEKLTNVEIPLSAVVRPCAFAYDPLEYVYYRPTSIAPQAFAYTYGITEFVVDKCLEYENWKDSTESYFNIGCSSSISYSDFYSREFDSVERDAPLNPFYYGDTDTVGSYTTNIYYKGSATEECMTEFIESLPQYYDNKGTYYPDVKLNAMTKAYIIPRTTSMNIPYSGGSKTIQVDYVNAEVIQAPKTSSEWLTIQQTQTGRTTIDGLPAIQVQYRLTVPETVGARQASITFSCQDANGIVATDSHFVLNQAAGPQVVVLNANKTASGTSGNTTVSVRVGYKNVDEILAPEILTEWCEILSYTDTNDLAAYDTTRVYTVRLYANDGYKRSTLITFKAAKDNVTVSDACTVTQAGTLANNNLSLDNYTHTFPYSGDTFFVRATLAYPSADEVCNVRVASGIVYPISWCKAELVSTEVEDDWTSSTEEWAITMSPNAFEEARQATVTFTYTNNYGETGMAVFTAIQEAPPVVEEDTTASIQPYVNTIKLDADGNNTIQSQSYINVMYKNIETINEPAINVDWFRFVTATTVTRGVTEVLMRYIWEVDENESETPRAGTITFSGLDASGNNISTTVAVEQEGSDGSVVQPTASITVNPTVLTFPQSGGTQGVTVTYNEAVTILNPSSVQDWCTVEPEALSSSSGIYKVTVPSTDIARQTNVIFSCVGADGKTVRNEELYVMQEGKNDTPTGSTEVYIGAIWKDVEYNFGGNTTYDYTIYDDNNNLLFSGRSNKRPNELGNKILVNKICQNYLKTPELNFNYVSSSAGYNTFTLRNAEGNYVLHTYKFINDWSYTAYKTGLVSYPIMNKPYIVQGQRCPFTVLGTTNQMTVPYGVTYTDGTSWNSTEYVTEEMKTVMFMRTDEKPFKRVHIGSKIYDVTDKCIEYVLYYVNGNGGYDWFPIEGRVNKTDEITAYHTTKNYNNTTLQFGRKRYLSEINRKYELHTGWLNDEESSRMWHLLESNTVYLHNIIEGKIYPVVITNYEVEHKKRTLLSSRISYTINVELSQTRMRI